MEKGRSLMASAIDPLPGIELPVSEVSGRLRAMWDQTDETGGRTRAPSEFRASQMTLILLLGGNTTTEEALRSFETAVEFSQRHPSRIIVLAPDSSLGADNPLRAKLYAQCFVGENQRAMCCCEGLILAYRPGSETFVENQVSIWLDSDLPAVAWLSSILPSSFRETFPRLQRMVRRTVWDSSLSGEERETDPPEDAYDLANARILPIRQSIGSLMSRFDPDAITAGATSVCLIHEPAYRAESIRLAHWLTAALRRCEQRAGREPSIDHHVVEGQVRTDDDLVVEWHGSKGTRCQFRIDFDQKLTRVNYAYADTTGETILRARQLKPSEALSEAVFF